ncbi:MAG: DUF4234 domain-containing protein [Candidatus Kapaibacterium sp.]
MENTTYPISQEEAVRGIAVSIILTFVTCGIYGLVWQYKQFQTINAWLGREEHNFWLYLLFSLITCGIYAIYYEYKFAVTVNEVQRRNNLEVTENLPLMCVLFGLFGIGIVGWAMEQDIINKWYGTSMD